MAEGLWFADASGILPLDTDDRAAVLAVAAELVDGGHA